MRFLANENFPLDAVTALREKGHDVAWIRTDAPGSRDDEVLARAVAEERILITLDKDFGELAYRSRLPASCGVILLRVQVSSSEYVVQLITAAVQAYSDWNGNFSVIEKNRIRVRPLPEG
jgi:predicted nuclease of predicted toxin-antitoxin system